MTKREIIDLIIELKHPDVLPSSTSELSVEDVEKLDYARFKKADTKFYWDRNSHRYDEAALMEILEGMREYKSYVREQKLNLLGI